MNPPPLDHIDLTMGRQHQIDRLRVRPSELPGSLWRSDLYPGPAFLLGVAIGFLVGGEGLLLCLGMFSR